MRSKCNYVFIAMQLFGNKYIVGHREGPLVLRVVICMLAPLWPVRPKVTRRGRLGLDIATTSSAVCVSDSLTQCTVLGLQFPGNSKKKMDLRLDLRLACGGKRKTVRPVFPQKTF